MPAEVALARAVAEADSHGRVGVVGEVLELVGIVLVIVEFLVAVGVLDIAPALGANGVVSGVMGC